MKNKEQTKTGAILLLMPVLAWMACAGFVIVTGAISISYAVSCKNPEGAKNLYMGLNLYGLRQLNFYYYTTSVCFLVALPAMKAWVCLLVANTLTKFNLNNPFTMDVVRRLEQISYVLLGIWVVTMLSNAYTGWLMKTTRKLYGSFLSGDFIFMVGIVFIFSQVFRRGVEIQSENDLTV